MVEIELAGIPPWLGRVLHLLSEDLAVNPSIEAYKRVPHLEDLLSQQGIFPHCLGQFSLVTLKEESVLVGLALLRGRARGQIDLEGGLARGRLLPHIALHLFSHSGCLCLLLLHLMQGLLVLGAEGSYGLAVLLTLAPSLCITLAAAGTHTCQFVLQSADPP